MSQESPPPTKSDRIHAQGLYNAYTTGRFDKNPFIKQHIENINKQDISQDDKILAFAALAKELNARAVNAASAAQPTPARRTGNDFLRRFGTFAAIALVAAGAALTEHITAPDNASKICDAKGDVKAELVAAIKDKNGGVAGGQKAAIDAYGGSYETLAAANKLYAEGGAQGLINALQGRCAFR
jgi:hypothetical protein